MRSILNWLFVFAFSISAHSGQVPLDRAASEQEAKLEVSLKKLSELRDSIHEERLPLVRELNELDRQVEELAAEVRRAERASGKDLADLEKLRAKVEADQREVDYLQKTLLPGFVANLDAAMSPVERPRLGETMRNFNLFLENSDVGELAKLERGLALIGSSFRSVENLLGGLILEGEALGPDGRLLAGTFVQTGPLVYFSAENGDLAGLIDVAAGSFDAHLQPLKGAGALAISELARS